VLDKRSEESLAYVPCDWGGEAWEGVEPISDGLRDWDDGDWDGLIGESLDGEVEAPGDICRRAHRLNWDSNGGREDVNEAKKLR
jgi:hypothetical protein